MSLYLESFLRAKKEYLVTWHKLRAENVNESDREQQHKQSDTQATWSSCMKTLNMSEKKSYVNSVWTENNINSK